MKTFTERLKEKFFRSDNHPYRIFEREIGRYLQPDITLLDAGCGRFADSLLKFEEKVKRLIGVDIVDFDSKFIHNKIELLKNDLKDIKLESRSVDLVISRSVMEHLAEPLPVYLEIHRILKQGGYFIFLTPNLGHYSTLFSKLIPNRFHPWFVSNAEGREEKDVFSTYYRSNSFNVIKVLARESKFNLVSLKYIGQYPCYFMFNPILFLIATSYEKVINKFDLLRYLRGWILVVLQKY